MIRPMKVQDAEVLAKLHCQRLGIPAHLHGAAVSVYRALVESPLASVTVSEENGQIEGFVLAACDRQRLFSDVFSRCPAVLLKQIICNPAGTMKLRELFRRAPQRQNAVGELLALYSDKAETLRELIAQALQNLYEKGVNCVISVNPEDAQTKTALIAADFREEGGALLRQLAENKQYVPGPFNLADRLRCAFRFELLVVAPIYSLVLIPFASYLAYWGSRADAWLGLPPLVATPWNFLICALLVISGGLLLVCSYSYLILEGEGGPVPPFSAKTRRLVTIGPYKYIRHPSIIAKLIGVTGLAFAFNSWVFLCVIIPLLMVWSIFWNRSRQDTDLVTVFGDEYLDYKRNTPMLVPRLWTKRS